MTEDERMELEWRIDELLSGGLDEPARTALLQRIVQDEPARAVLDEALILRRQARAAFGYTDEAMAASLEALHEHLEDCRAGRMELPQPAGAPRLQQPNPLRMLWRPTVLVRIAALVVVAVSAFVAATVWRRPGSVAEPAHDVRFVAMQEPAENQLARYRTVWSNVLDTTDNALPCIVLDNSGGRIHYVAGQGPAQPGRLVLYRCLLLDANNRHLSRVNLLLPADRAVRLPVPQVAADGKLPVRYNVWIDGEWAGVDLTVGDRPAKHGGVAGRTRIGNRPVEIGTFRIDNKPIRVVLQAVPVPLDVSAT